MDSWGQCAFSMPIKLLVVSELKDLSKIVKVTYFPLK